MAKLVMALFAWWLIWQGPSLGVAGPFDSETACLIVKETIVELYRWNPLPLRCINDRG